jgi:RNA polymerase sigma factor FliA
MVGDAVAPPIRRGYRTSALHDHKRAGRSYGAPMTDVAIASVLPGVRRMARRTPLARNGVMDVDDMEQDAVVGLLSAARSFDPGRGASFATHAYPRARGALLDGQRAMDHVPRTWRAAQRRVIRARTALVGELATEPTPEELAERLGISTQELRDIDERCRTPAGLAEPLKRQATRGEPLTVADLIPDEEPLPDELVVAREDAAHLHAAIEVLPPRLRFVIHATWFSDLTTGEIAHGLRVSESRVSQLRTEAMERLGTLVSELRQAA